MLRAPPPGDRFRKVSDGSVWLDFDAFAGMIFAQQFGLGRVAREDRIRVFDEPSGLQEQTKKFSPLKTFVSGPVEFGFHRGRQVQQPAMNRNHEGQMTPARHSGSDAAQASQCVRMNERHVWFTPERGQQIERHQVPAQRDELTFSAREIPHAGTHALNRLISLLFSFGVRLSCGQYSTGVMSCWRRPSKSWPRRSPCRPIRRIVFSQKMNHAHDGSPANVASVS